MTEKSYNSTYEHSMYEDINSYFLTSTEILTGFEYLSFVEPFYNHGLVTNRCQWSFKVSNVTFTQVAQILELQQKSEQKQL